MIHHVQRKRIHNAAAINKGMKHWSKVLFIWRLHAADVCSSLPPPPLFLSFLTTFSETGHITTARYAVKDVLKSRCCGFTVHNAGLKARFALYVSNRGMWVCLCYWTWPRRCRFRVQRGGFFSSPRRCQPRYPREHRHQTHRGFFLSIYVTPDLSLNREAPSFCRSNCPSVSSLLSSVRGVSGFKFTVKPGPDMLRAVAQSVWSKNTEWICCFYLCVLCNRVWSGWK